MRVGGCRTLHLPAARMLNYSFLRELQHWVTRRSLLLPVCPWYSFAE